MFKFKSLFDKLLIAPANTKTFSVDEYMKTIESGKWCDRFVFGISEAEKDFSTANFVDQPGAFYFGGTGSGKSKGTKFSAITRMLTNSDRDVFILMDPQKGMTDYKTLFPYRDNVAVALDDASKIVALIDMLYEEIMARKAAFSSVGASDIFVYEATMKQKNPKFQLARIIVFFEEFHATINSDSLKYAMKSDTEGTAAWKFRQLAKIARSYGLNFVIITQRCSSDDCPSSLKAATTTFLGFRVNSPGDAAVANLPLAADIPSNLRGRCVTENGYMQFPYLTDDTAEKLLKKYYQPLRAKMLKYTVADFQKALEGEGNEGLVLIKAFKELIIQLYSVLPANVCMRFLKTFDFEVEKQTNTALAVQLVATRDGKKYAVMCVTNGRTQTSAKGLEAFKAGAQILGCDHAIIMGTESLGIGVDKITQSGFKSGIVADGEDMSRMAEVLDNKDRLELEGNYEKLYSKLVLAKKQDLPIEEQSDDDEDEDNEPLELQKIREQLRNKK